jgi:heme/copper-type cytochrome/quinol oxidase subunit 2
MDEAQHEEYEEQTGVSTYWWIRQIILILIAGFYLVLGIQLLVSAYRLNDPPTFILTFYASNFMILISATLLVGFIYRMVVTYRRSKKAPPQSLT